LLPVLTPAERELLVATRRATLATIAPDGAPRLVPVCFVVIGDVVWSPLDEKPKAVDDVRSLARVRDIRERPTVALLVDRWSETKYPQYADHDLESRPMIRIEIAGVRSWSAAGG
jgi:hypothetical protein